MGETNYIHEAEIWKGRLETETKGAEEWYKNWGFLAGKELPPPRGFSSNVAKYAYGSGQWTVSNVRVPDSSKEGLAAAKSEQDARKRMSTLTWETQPAHPTKPCAAKVRAPRHVPDAAPASRRASLTRRCCCVRRRA